MPPVRLDMTGQKFDVLPDGEYDAVIGSWKSKGLSKGAKTSGAPMIEITYALDQGGKIWENHIFHANSIWTFKRMAVAAGLDAADFEGERDILFASEAEDYPDVEDPLIVDDVMEQIIGSRVKLVLKTRPANGEYAARNEVAKVLPADDDLSSSGWARKAA
jgi:hypothetical protein